MHFCDSQVIFMISVFHKIIIHAEFNNNNEDLLIEYIAGFWTQIEKNFILQNCENTTQFQTITMHISHAIYQHMTGKLLWTIHPFWETTTITLMIRSWHKCLFGSDLWSLLISCIYKLNKMKIWKKYCSYKKTPFSIAIMVPVIYIFVFYTYSFGFHMSQYRMVLGHC